MTLEQNSSPKLIFAVPMKQYTPAKQQTLLNEVSEHEIADIDRNTFDKIPEGN